MKRDFIKIKEDFEKKHPNLEMDRERYVTTSTKTRREFHIINKETLCEFWAQSRSLNSYNYNIIRYNTENIRFLINKKTNGEYQLVSECKGYNDKIEILHKTCGSILTIRASHFINDNTRCKICQHKKFKSGNEKFDAELEKYSKEFKRASEYINYHSDIAIKCLKCNRVFITKPVNIRRQYTDLGCIHCPTCDGETFYGEEIIKNYLQKITLNDNLVFKSQFTHPKCKYKRLLKMDFAILEITNLTGLPKAVIEFDGPQHNDPNSKFAKLDSFSEIQNRDLTKNKFCQDNNIPILRIDTFNKEQIESQVNEFLKNNNLLKQK